MQPGSSIMPGKVNPVIPEVVNQVAFKVIGNDLTVTIAAEAGQLELNVMEPIIVHSLFESIDLLSNGMNTLRDRRGLPPVGLQQHRTGNGTQPLSGLCDFDRAGQNRARNR